MQSLDVISVNLWQILISLANLLILFLIIKKFLYAPVKNILAKRESEIENRYSEAGKAIEEASCHQLLADTVALALNRACGEKLRADGVWQSVMIGAFCGAFIDSSKRGSIDDVNDYVQALKKMLLH